MRPSAGRVVTQSLAQVQIWTVALVLIIAGKTAGQCTDGELRLVNGGTQFEGRLEVCLGNQWGTICDDYWKSNSFNAQVACRQLGFSSQGARTRASDPNTFQPPPFGQGTGLIFWDDVRCTGSEQRLDECPHLTTLQGSDDCIHDEDVGVTCQPLPATLPPTTTRAIPESPTHQITEIDANIFIEMDINTTKINIDTSIDIDVELTTTQNTDSEDKLKNVTKQTTLGTKQTSTGPTSVTESRLENEAQHVYTKLIVIPIGVLLMLTSVSVGVMVLLCLVTTKNRRTAKSMETGAIEAYVDIDHIQDQGDFNVHFSTVDQRNSRIDAGSGKLVPNFSYDLRKAWQRPHKEIEAHANPAYAVAPYPGVILQEEVTLDAANHHYETVAEATKGAAKVYCNVGALLQDQHATAETRPQNYINLH